jgi:hypothetical protein
VAEERERDQVQVRHAVVARWDPGSPVEEVVLAPAYALLELGAGGRACPLAGLGGGGNAAGGAAEYDELPDAKPVPAGSSAHWAMGM